MRLQPKSEDEIATANLLPKGEYLFEVVEAVDKPSAKGNEMIALKLSIHADDFTRGVFDYLVDIESMAYKLRHFADAVGVLDQYENGGMDADTLIGLTGKCKLDIQPAKDGYGPKNVVKDYLKRANGGAVTSQPSAPIVDDLIPF